MDQKPVTQMNDAEFAAHMANLHGVLARIEAGIASLRSDYAVIADKLDELLQPQRDEADRLSYRAAGSPNG